MAPVTSVEKLLACRLRFETGSFTSVYALAREFGINEKSLHARIKREGWTKKRDEILRQAERKIEKKIVDQAEVFLSTLKTRISRYHKIIDASISQCATDSEGNALVEPSDIDVYTRSENRLKDIGAFAHRIAAVSQLDLTSGGQSIGDIVSAIAKLRESGNAVAFSDEDKARILECEIENPNPK